MFANIGEIERRGRDRRDLAGERDRVLALFDQINAAVFMRRPQSEIDKLLCKLERATRRKRRANAPNRTVA